jgi:hypothetical protein
MPYFNQYFRIQLNRCPVCSTSVFQGLLRFTSLHQD